MREGNNPQRGKKVNLKRCDHRIIIPLHIPVMEGYYKDSFSIFKLCLNSLFKTISTSSAITIVNNGCDEMVVAYLNEFYLKGKINEVIHTQKIGKINAIFKGIRSAREEYITITDADVLFKSGWLSETLRIFKAFHKTAVVGLVPQFKMYENFSYNVLFDSFFSKDLKFTPVKDVEDLKAFYRSINWSDDYNQDYLKYNLSIKKDNTCAIVGTGHFVATYKKSIFDEEMEGTDFLLGGDSIVKNLDILAAKKNLWRLNTEHCYAYHMGNKLENWMQEYAERQEQITERVIVFPNAAKLYENRPLLFFIKHKLFSRMFQKYIKKRFYKLKGLPVDVAENY